MNKEERRQIVSDTIYVFRQGFDGDRPVSVQLDGSYGILSHDYGIYSVNLFDGDGVWTEDVGIRKLRFYKYHIKKIGAKIPQKTFASRNLVECHDIYDYPIMSQRWWGLPENTLSIFHLNAEYKGTVKRYAFVSKDDGCDTFCAIMKNNKSFRVIVWVDYSSQKSSITMPILDRDFVYMNEFQEIMLLARQYEICDLITDMFYDINEKNDGIISQSTK